MYRERSDSLKKGNEKTARGNNFRRMPGRRANDRAAHERTRTELGRRSAPSYQKPEFQRETCAYTLSFKVWIQSWRNKRDYSLLKRSTQQKYDQILNKHILPYWGDMNLREIDGAGIQAFADNLLARGLAQGTVRDVIRLLKNLLKAAAKAESSSFVPDFKLVIPGAAGQEQKILSRKEQMILQQHAEEKDLPAMVSLYTGLRLGEICALKWMDIDWQCTTITVRRAVQRLNVPNGITRTALVVDSPKSRSSYRTVPMPAFLAASLKEYRGSAGQEDYIFGSEDRPADPRTIQARFQRLLTKAGIPPMHFHGLRHTFTTRLIELGTDIKTVSSLLGHSSVQTTMEIYAHSQMETKRTAIDLLEKTMKN